MHQIPKSALVALVTRIALVVPTRIDAQTVSGQARVVHASVIETTGTATTVLSESAPPGSRRS